METKIVVDTNVLLGALIGKNYGVNRQLLRLCFNGQYQPVIGNTLFSEYEEIINREDIMIKSPFNLQERNDFFDDFLSICQWTKIYYLWRPNLIDEGDNHLIELAVASNAKIIATHNVKDLVSSQLKFPQISIQKPREIIEKSCLF